MKFYKPLIVALFLIWFLINPLHAQSEPRSLYLQVSSETIDSVKLLDLSTGENETIYSVSQQIKGVNLDIFPQDEIDALNAFRPEYEKITGRVMGRLEGSLVRARIDSLIVSPNNNNVVAEVIYTTCLNPLYNTCFGTTHLVLIDSSDNSQHTLLSLGMHSDVYMLSYNEVLTNFVVRSIQWTPDQQAIVIGIADSGDRSQIPRSAIIVVPIDGSKPFKVGEGTRWAIAPNSRQIAVIRTSETQPEDNPNIINLIGFDLISKQSSTMSYPIGNYFIYYDAGIVYADQFPLFSIAFDTSKLGDGDWVGGGLTFFDTQTATPTIAIPNPEGYVSRLDNTPDGKVTIAQMLDGTLSRILMVGKTMELQPITSTPVASWNLNSDGEILVQFAGDNTYQVLDAQGNIKQSFDLNQMTRSLGTDTSQIIAVDW